MHTKRILIVDDEHEQRKSAYKSLEKNINLRLQEQGETSRQVKFVFLERWGALHGESNPCNYDAIISDYFLENPSQDPMVIPPSKSTSEK